MANFKSNKKSTYKDTLGRAAFRAGFEDKKKGKTFDESWSLKLLKRGRSMINLGVTYERGRQFAVVYDGSLKRGRYVLPEAVAALAKFHQSGDML